MFLYLQNYYSLSTSCLYLHYKHTFHSGCVLSTLYVYCTDQQSMCSLYLYLIDNDNKHKHNGLNIQSNVYVTKGISYIALHLQWNYSSMFICGGQQFFSVTIGYLLLILLLIASSLFRDF